MSKPAPPPSVEPGQREFVERGLAGLAEAERTGVFCTPAQVIAELRAMTQARREQLTKR